MSIRFTNHARIKESWDKYNIQIGIPVIDLQHLWLLSLIVDLDNTKTDLLSVQDLKSYLFTLTEFVSEHFSLEEKLLQHISYPDLDSHIKSHRNYTGQIKKLYKEGIDDIYSISTKICVILNKWLVEHIKGEDLQYKEYILKNNIEIEELNSELIKSANISRYQAFLYNKILGNSNIHQTINKNVMDNIKNIWKTYDLSVKIPIIDMQHLWLVKILTDLDIASKNLGGEKKNEVFQLTMQKAIKYTDEHFGTEELLMEKFEYPKLARHKARHQQFIENLATRNQEAQKNDPSAAFNLVKDLREWLLSHIALEDKSLRRFFNGKMSQVSEYIQNLNNQGKLKLNGYEVNLYKEMKSAKLI